MYIMAKSLKSLLSKINLVDVVVFLVLVAVLMCLMKKMNIVEGLCLAGEGGDDSCGLHISSDICTENGCSWEPSEQCEEWCCTEYLNERGSLNYSTMLREPACSGCVRWEGGVIPGDGRRPELQSNLQEATTNICRDRLIQEQAAELEQECERCRVRCP